MPATEDFDAAYVANALRRSRTVSRMADRYGGRVRKVWAGLKWLFARRAYRHLADPGKVIWVPLDGIRYFLRDSRIRRSTVQGSVAGGDWDREALPWDHVMANSTKWAGVRQHFAEGTHWNETDLFRLRYARVFRAGGRVRGTWTEEDLLRKYERYDRIYESIRERGIVSPAEDPAIDPIYVHINRDGEFLYTANGLHRLYMAILLGKDQIPVQVWWRHSGWQKTREAYAELGPEERRRRFPGLSGHPDLQDIPEE